MIVEGVVVHFDEARGDGRLRLESGVELAFHCVHILDGSRHVDEGQRVRARRVVGLRGRDEAAQLEKI